MDLTESIVGQEDDRSRRKEDGALPSRSASTALILPPNFKAVIRRLIIR